MLAVGSTCSCCQRHHSCYSNCKAQRRASSLCHHPSPRVRQSKEGAGVRETSAQGCAHSMPLGPAEHWVPRSIPSFPFLSLHLQPTQVAQPAFSPPHRGPLGRMLSPQGCRDEDVMLGMLQGAAQPVGEQEAHTELCFAKRLPSHRRLNWALRGSQHCAILLRQKCLASPGAACINI